LNGIEEQNQNQRKRQALTKIERNSARFSYTNPTRAHLRLETYEYQQVILIIPNHGYTKDIIGTSIEKVLENIDEDKDCSD